MKTALIALAFSAPAIALTVFVIGLVIFADYYVAGAVAIVGLVAFAPRDPKDKHGSDFDSWTA